MGPGKKVLPDFFLQLSALDFFFPNSVELGNFFWQKLKADLDNLPAVFDVGLLEKSGAETRGEKVF